MQAASLEDIQMNLRRYVNRMNSNARGKTESLRDLNKIAHYACIVWNKYIRGEIKGDLTKVFTFDPETDDKYEFIKKIIEEL